MDKMYQDFVDYLKLKNNCKQVWVREEIEAEFKSFKISRKDITASAEYFLLAASCMEPPLLRDGSVVRLRHGFEKLSTCQNDPAECEANQNCPDRHASPINLELGTTGDNIPSSLVEIPAGKGMRESDSLGHKADEKVPQSLQCDTSYSNVYRSKSPSTNGMDQKSSWRQPLERNVEVMSHKSPRMKTPEVLSFADQNKSWREPKKGIDSVVPLVRCQANNEADQNTSWRQPLERDVEMMSHKSPRIKTKNTLSFADQNKSWRQPLERDVEVMSRKSPRIKTENGLSVADQKCRQPLERDVEVMSRKSSRIKTENGLSFADQNKSWREPPKEINSARHMYSSNYSYVPPRSLACQLWNEAEQNASWRESSNEQNYVDGLKRQRYEAGNIIKGVKPECLRGGDDNVTKILGHFEADKQIKLSYKLGMLSRNPVLSEILSPRNYIEKFHLLLSIEDLQNLDEIELFTIESTVLRKNPDNELDQLRYLDVPENGPSLLVGDRVYATPWYADGRVREFAFEGYVHAVGKQQIRLGFNTEVLDALLEPNVNFRVRFTLNRRPLRLMHNALDELSLFRLHKMLFPLHPPKPYNPPKNRLVMSNNRIASNDEQRTAVENIILGKIPPIYIIFGPPGTGKTVTMVEAIYQTYKRYNYSILVCALCNDACDMLASKLLDFVNESEMMRVYAASRSWKNVPHKIKQGETNFHYDEGELYMPDEQELMRYRIIVCTFVTAGRISLMNFPDDHFQRVFVDESGQAFEPECLIAVSGILAEDGKLILAGDPKQLGPIVKSKLAKKHGLQISLLQRLMDTCPIYQKAKITGKYNHQCVTKLVRNYRSHEAILSISNQHFYDGDLLVCADESERAKMCGWEWLKNKEFPIIFHGVEGQQTQDQSSPSYYNPDEIMIVKDYVNKLMRSGRHQLSSAKQIGIVTPYKMQCKKIQEAVATYGDIDVGSVEVFQGQERLVIIISTVRSSDERLTDNPFRHLGFLCDPRRFNVAITRAKALLIIVGNPRLLSLDKYWRSLLKYCMENNAYRGVKLSSIAFEGVNDVEEIKELFQKLDIVSNHECGNGEDDLLHTIR